MNRLVRSVSLRRQGSVTHGDDGVTLVETIVAISLIGIIMSALITFFIGGVQATNGYRLRQQASVLADQAVERVNALKPAAINSGRDPVTEAVVWSKATSLGLSTSDTLESPDATALSGAGATAALPTSPVQQTLDGHVYYVWYVVGKCFQKVASSGTAATCTSVIPTGTYVTNYRVLISVDFPQAGSVCTSGSCRFVTSTIVNAGIDTTFNNS